MLKEKEGITNSILLKLGVPIEGITGKLRDIINNFPKINGISDTYISDETKKNMDAAFSEATQKKDQYVSIEHILLAVSGQKTGKAANLLAGFSVTRESILTVCSWTLEAHNV